MSTMPTTRELIAVGAPAALRDGSRVRLRQGHHTDRDLLVRAFARLSSEGIGVARYVRDPTHPETAEVAVTVIDEWQGRGLGTLLMEVLGARARAEGIRGFTAMMLATNQKMMELLEGLGPVHVLDRDAGTVEIETPIPDTGLAPALRKLLQIAARDGAGIPPAA